MNPPNLPFQRSVRASADVKIYFTPNSTGQDIVQNNGHVFILTDLFLSCEKIAPLDRTGVDGPDVSLCYPPLAGKHLRVIEIPGDETAFQVLIMNKETLTLVTESRMARDQLIGHFNDCIEFASNREDSSFFSSITELTGPRLQLPRRKSNHRLLR